MYELLLSIHLLAAATWLGGNIALTVLASRMSGGDRMTIAPHLNWYESRVLPASAFVLILAGIGLVLELDHVGFGDTWVIVGLVGWLASAVIGGAVIGPIGDKLTQSPTPEEADALYARLVKISRIDTLILIVVVIDMAVKPGA